MSDPDQYLKKAKALIAELYYRENITREDYKLTVDDLYVVWFAKTLGNWKALISTDKWDNCYWEVTYNGAKKEAYIDVYYKEHNFCVPDKE